MDVSFCPVCGAALDEPAFVQEYWTGEDRQFLCWCRACTTMSAIVLAATSSPTNPSTDGYRTRRCDVGRPRPRLCGHPCHNPLWEAHDVEVRVEAGHDPDIIGSR